MKLLIELDEEYVKVIDEIKFLVGGRTNRKLQLELIKEHHRVEWRVIEGNHAKRGYDAFCKKHNGNSVCLHDVTKDLKGKYRNEYIYEILRKSTS